MTKNKKTAINETFFLVDSTCGDLTKKTKKELDEDLNDGSRDGGEEILEVKVIKRFKVVDRKQELREA